MKLTDNEKRDVVKLIEEGKVLPEKYRFFFPQEHKNFLLYSNSGTLKTHLSSNGYLTSGLRHWFSLNGPMMNNDLITITLNDQEKSLYELIYKKNNESNP